MSAIVRLAVIIAVLGLGAFAAMFALVQFVEPESRDISVTVQPSKMNK